MKLLFKTLCLFAFYSVVSFAAPTALTVQTISETPLSSTNYENADNSEGNSASNYNCDLMLLFEIPSGSTGTATVTAQTTSKTIPGVGVVSRSDITVTLSSAETEIVGPLRCNIWNDSSGLVQVTYSGSNPGDINVLAFRQSTAY